eukprot:m.212302 g.212302  ORF g.212302 m.212302 type:complete len:400 (-) comp22147_c7_seq2:148-1347(-)
MAAAMPAISSKFRSERDENIKEERFDLLGRIGEGTYGVVYKTVRKKSLDKSVYALKCMKGMSPTALDGLSIAACREIALLRDLKHENVIRAQEIFLSNKSHEVCFLLDYAEYDLWGILDTHRKAKNGTPPYPPESLQKSILWQLLNGMHYLHCNWILHRDLKPANILVMGDGPENGRVKIADLGMARLFQSPLKTFTEVDPVVVTFWYRSPELLLGAKHYTKAIDIWAIGCIMGELMTARPIFCARNGDKSKESYNKEQLQEIFKVLSYPTPVKGSPREWQHMDQLPEYTRFCQHFEKEMKQPPAAPLEEHFRNVKPVPSPAKCSLLSQLLKIDPLQRISALAAMDHKYFSERPLPSMNVFEGVDIHYPERELKNKEPEKPPEKQPARGRNSQAKRHKE